MFNQIQLIGNLGTDPVMRYTPEGIAVTDFRLAVNYKSSREESVEWFTVTCWNNLAESVNQYLEKGRQIFVQGRLRTNTYEANDGSTRFTVEVIANNVQFLGRPESGDSDIESEESEEVKEEEVKPKAKSTAKARS